MKIRLAKTAGFCMGVRRAVDMVLDLQRTKPPQPIVTYGPLIHNPQTLALLKTRGIKEVKCLDEISQGTVVIRAHGISPQERDILKSKGVGIIDATCPRVSRVQAVIKKYAAKGHFTVIVGDKDHPEVRGLMGFALAGGVIIPSVNNIPEDLPSDREICVVAQTTQEVAAFDQIVEQLRKINPNINVFNTICDSTRRRQIEVNRLANSVEMVVVVGGKGSGNTRRLAKVAESQGVKALHIETADELPANELADVNVVGVTAGASTPNWQIRRVIENLRQVGMRPGPLKTLRDISDTTIMTYCWAAAAGAGLTAACLRMQGLPAAVLPMMVSALFVFSMHLLNRIQERSGAVRFNTPDIAAFYVEHKKLLTGLGLSASIAALILSTQLGVISTLLLLAMMITGRLYTAPLPERFMPSLKWRSLKDLPGSKTPLVALGWATCAAALPVLGRPEIVGPHTAIAFLVAAGVVFWRTALSDLLDIQGDRIVGRETIPIIMGVKNTRKLLVAILIYLGCLIVLSVIFGLISGTGLILLINILVFAGFFIVYKKRHLVDRLMFEAIMDGNIIIAGLLSVFV